MSGDTSDFSGPGAGQFTATHWSVVLAAGDPSAPGNQAALDLFCQAYWYPLYAFACRSGRLRAEAQDLTQEFFARLVDKNLLAGVTREGGKFRSYLLTVFKNFAANEWSREHAQKRGGGKPVLCIDESVEGRYLRELIDHTTPETLYDRSWALTVLEQAYENLRDEYRASGRTKVFAVLRGCLSGAQGDVSYAEVRKALGLSKEAARVAVHRLRRRYGELLRQEVAVFGMKPEEIDEEIKYLMEAVAQRCGCDR